jgi:hypothetical protein
LTPPFKNRTDYTPEEITGKREILRKTEEMLSAARSDLWPFAEYDRKNKIGIKDSMTLIAILLLALILPLSGQTGGKSPQGWYLKSPPPLYKNPTANRRYTSGFA